MFKFQNHIKLYSKCGKFSSPHKEYRIVHKNLIGKREGKLQLGRQECVSRYYKN